MSHQPYENWIIDQETLPVDERRSLQSHLDTCQQCLQLHRKWQDVQRELRAKKMIAPAVGFTQRWQASLAERRAHQVRRQAWKAFMIFMCSAFVILLALVGYIMSVSSPADWLAVIIRYGSYSLNLFDAFFVAAQIWLASTPLALNIALWIYLTVTLCLLSLAWVFALWRTSILGVFNK